MRVKHLYTEPEFKAAARSLMDHFSLRGWALEVKELGKTEEGLLSLGQCDFSTLTLSFSRDIMPTVNVLAQREVILHEIAHALAGVEAEH